MLQLLKVLNYCNASIWGITGLLIMGSNYYLAYVGNYVIGLLFIAIACFLFCKFRTTISLTKTGENHSSAQQLIRKNLRFEIALVLVAMFMGIIFFLATFSRVFGEKKAVFG